MRFVLMLALCLVLASPTYAQQQSGWSTARLSGTHTNILSVVVGTTALFAGGPIQRDPVDTFAVYDQSGGQWTTGHLPEPIGRGTLLTAGRRLLVVPDGLRALDVLDISSGQWTGFTLDQSWPPQSSILPPLVIGQDVVFVRKDGAQVYDGAAGTLLSSQPLHTSDVAPVAVSVGSTLLLAGRSAFNTDALHGIDMFNSTTGIWTTTTAAPIRVGAGAAVGEKALFVAGPQPGSAQVSTALYDPATDTWTTGEVPMAGGKLALGDNTRGPSIASDGRRAVLLVPVMPYAGGPQAAMIYDSQTGRWTPGDGLVPWTAWAARYMPFQWLGPRLIARGIPAGEIGIVDTDTGRVTATNAPTQRYGPSDPTMVALGGKVILAGGEWSDRANGGPTAAVDIYDLASGTWTAEQLAAADMNPLSEIRGSSVLFWSNGTVSRFDADTGAWTSVSPPNNSLVEKLELIPTPGGPALFAGFGKNDQGTPVATVLTYDVATGAWQSSVTALTPSDARSVAAGSQVVFAGGTVDAQQGLVDVFDGPTGHWGTTLMPDCPQPSMDPAATAVGGLALFAACSPELVQVYDSLSGSWSTAPLSVARSRLGATSVGTLALFGGGLVVNDASDVVDVYDAATDSWTTATLSEARASPAAASTGRFAVFAGGWQGLGNPSDAVDIFDSLTGEWSTAHLSQARRDLAAASVGSKILIGGGNTAHNVSDTIDVFDTVAGTWSTARLSRPRFSLAAVTVGTHVVFAGGLGPNAQGANDPSDTVDIYDDATGRWTTASLSAPGGGITGVALSGRAMFASGSSRVVDIFTP